MKTQTQSTTSVHPLQRAHQWRKFFVIPLALAMAGALPAVQAVCRQGCDTSTSDTFLGDNALDSEIDGSGNTAIGAFAMEDNFAGSENVAVGLQALGNNFGGSGNSAVGFWALLNSNAVNNTALGYQALLNNTSGSSNIAIGDSAGINLTTGSNNIDIGNKGVAAEANTIRIGKKGTQTTTIIAGIRGTTVATGIGVLVDSNGRLGTTTSSARFKDNIRPMDKASEAILSLRPVTFRYTHELDSQSIPQFGLVAEEVAKVNPDLVARDEEGKPYTVRYDAVNAMLLNEFLKEHKKNEQQQGMIVEQQKQIQTLTAALREQSAQIQKVAAQLSTMQSTPRVVANE